MPLDVWNQVAGGQEAQRHAFPFVSSLRGKQLCCSWGNYRYLFPIGEVVLIDRIWFWTLFRARMQFMILNARKEGQLRLQLFGRMSLLACFHSGFCEPQLQMHHGRFFGHMLDLLALILFFSFLCSILFCSGMWHFRALTFTNKVLTYVIDTNTLSPQWNCNKIIMHYIVL